MCVSHSNSTLVSPIQIPIVWENGRLSNFTMLVAHHILWPILFGQNNLRLVDEHICSGVLDVYFGDKTIDFEIFCHDTNPTSAFPSLRNRASSIGSFVHDTCLLTAVASQGLHIVAASCVGSPLLSGPFCLRGNQFSLRLQTLRPPVLPKVASPGEMPPLLLASNHPARLKCCLSWKHLCLSSWF